MLNVGTDDIETWVFVTGVIRSGTTFTGKILSLPLPVDYIHEPFNTGCGMEGMNRRYRYVRPGLDTAEMRRIHRLTRRIFDYDFSLQTVCYDGDSWYRNLGKRLVGSRGPFYLRLAKANPFHRAAVIKDPTASMMSRYLADRFGVEPVILIRHPVSLVASFRRLDWWPQAEKLLEQQALVTDHLAGAPEASKRSSSCLPDPVANACRHWCLVNRVLLRWARRHNWPVVRHEDLCENPRERFRQLYDRLSLPWTRRVPSKIESLTSAASPEAGGNVQDFQRDSASIFATRRDSVDPDTRQAIFDLTSDVALKVYDRSSFALS
jgi:hypothetical protein